MVTKALIRHRDRVLGTHRLKLFLLPAYSPELNPDEWVWKNVKVRHEAPSFRAV
jgi:transposase